MLKAELISQLLGCPPPEHPLAPASGASFHSARVRPGDAFFALAGEHSHGIEFADDALARGAAFIISDQPHPQGLLVEDASQALLTLGRHARQQLRGPLVAVSGSAGKTTTKALLAAALAARSTPGNFNTPLALATVLVDAWQNAPERQAVVLELGIDHPGEMALLTKLVRPTHGLLTLIAESHLQGLGDLATVAREKSVLLQQSPIAFASLQAAALLPAGLQARLIAYGLGDHPPKGIPPAKQLFLGELTDNSGGGQTLEILGVRLKLPVPSSALAQNAVGAVVLARQLGIPNDLIGRRLARATLEPGRLQKRLLRQGLLLDDTYNSNPASAQAALETLRQLPGPRIAVLGDMLELGDQAAELHYLLGLATRDIDTVIAVGPLARNLQRGNPKARHVEAVEEVPELLRRLPGEATVLLKASRGMHFEVLADALLAEEENR